MPDIKLQPLLEAIHPRNMQPALEPFFGQLWKPPAFETSRLQAPVCYWAVYTSDGRRVTFKSFFSADTYESYVDQLRRHYGDRFNEPQHPWGGIQLVPELNAVLWGFPFDPHMPALHRCADARWVAELIGRHSATPLQVKVVNYNPEIGAIFAYRDGRGPRAYGKATATAQGEHVFEIMERLWWSTERAAGELRVARPLAWVPEANFLLQSAVPGRTVLSRRNSTLFLDLARVAGSWLALVHACDTPYGAPRTLDHELSRLRNWMGELELTAPQLYATMRLLLEQIEARARAPLQLRLVPSHGDYKWNQFLHHRGRFALIDFELFCRAERWFDLGYFCAYLPPTSPDDWRDGLATELLRTIFLEAYAHSAGLPLDLERIGLYEATTLATRAMTLVWQHQGSWYLRASSLLDMAIDRLVSPELRPVDAPVAVAV
ncbi:MAG TPA: aminoglycoside phosphotransferase family protein [Chloroflexota bacterium]